MEGIGRISVLLKTDSKIDFLAQYLVRKWKTIDFNKPYYAVERQDSEDIRQKILISYTDWKKMGFSKGTLHYMKQNGMDDKPFTLNANVRERLEM